MKNRLKQVFDKLGIQDIDLYSETGLVIYSPIDGHAIARIKQDNEKDLDTKIEQAHKAFLKWRDVPAPKRGELIGAFGRTLEVHKNLLAEVVCIENGKIMEEAKGEVQEMIDICNFSLGFSRQLYGLTIASERAEHKMQENWLPLGVVAVISAFNFPVAVWAWNLAIALSCGNTVVWKPSSKTPLSALVCQRLFEQNAAQFDFAPANIALLSIIEPNEAPQLLNEPKIQLVSATGSCAMGKKIAPIIAKNFKKQILELGGNNASIITPSADLEIAISSIVFGAVGTCGQRCTTTRRLLVHHSLLPEVKKRLFKAYGNLEPVVGNPLEAKTLIGPLIDKQAYEQMQEALTKAREEGNEIFGGNRIKTHFNEAYYVQPALVITNKNSKIAQEETFAPILYVMGYETIEEALEINNSVPQGLSSSIYSTDIREIEYFKTYSDCGISNVNIGTSGAEIGGAFGGEKETGGGRESGSDAWKQYMRRQTSTTYFGNKKPELAQGIEFEI